MQLGLGKLSLTTVGKLIGNGIPAPAFATYFTGVTTLDPRITFTRASSATYVDSAGVLQTTTTNTPRFTHDPVTLAPLGLMVEEARTNSIRNITMVGAGIGVLPTNWGSAFPVGITVSCVGVGVEDGVSYIDARFSGTNTSGSEAYPGLFFDGNIASSASTAYTHSLFPKMVGGSATNVTLPMHGFYELTSGAGFIKTSSANFTLTSSGSLAALRKANAFTTSATCAFTKPLFAFTVANGAAIDITLRIGMPQLELGASATSVIPTTTASATRAADVATMTGTNFSSWYNQTEGTFVVEAYREDVVPSGVYCGVVCLGTLTDSINIGYLTNSVSSLEVAVGGASQVGAYLALGTQNRKIAAAYKLNDYAISANGASATVDTAGTVPTVSIMYIGSRQSGGVPLNGTVKSIRYYNTRLTNAQLASLSA
jgi:hypothetical protein